MKSFIKMMCVVSFALCASISAAEEYVAGEDYDLINPPFRTANPDKIEVREFFWYGCGHCFTFEPLLAAWKKTLADDVDFQPSPAIWNAPMKTHAKVFFAVEALGLGDSMHRAIFQAMHVDRNPLTTDAAILKLFKSQGVSEADFNRAYKSFGVATKAKRAVQLQNEFKIEGVPSLGVAGRYYIDGTLAGSMPRALQVADALIAQTRQGR